MLSVWETLKRSPPKEIRKPARVTCEHAGAYALQVIHCQSRPTSCSSGRGRIATDEQQLSLTHARSLALGMDCRSDGVLGQRDHRILVPRALTEHFCADLFFGMHPGALSHSAVPGDWQDMRYHESDIVGMLELIV